ncbi:hypothetical protein P3T76_012650 [Phytophthora citrophthora]|uniref:Uncharacterized protein n=1 Tax=Phytophthora citrophthora TaxID=4793 RepID=A0AAD9LCM0_9STRA|nr:hypothetical protein P3T76_012650 [Phytophthora citrophthora]
MPPLTATTGAVKPYVLVPMKESDIGTKDCAKFCEDGWLEKVFDRQDGAVAERKKRKQNFIQRTLGSLTHHHSKKENKNLYEEDSYQDELQKYIAESSANLRYDDLDSSDEETSEEESDPVSISPRNAEIFDFSASIVSISSDKSDEYVKPPVEVPRKYRTQDRQGGVLVAGDYVLFTHWAFKREKRRLGRMGPLPERAEAHLSSVEEVLDGVSVGKYSGKIIEL